MVPDTCLKDRYRLGRYPLAHKGMGEVWPAQDTLLERPVIVKLVDAAMLDRELLRRFRREALLTARLDHPGVPAIYDLGEHDGHPYLVLQKVDGITVADLIAEQEQLPIGWAAAIGAQASSVLIAAQALGLVHRDIKPSNIMLETSGAVKVLDFGLAVIHDDKRYSRITQSGQRLGTVGYMAPEQILGEPTDHRTDLYGLGATLFESLTGRPPFGERTTMTMLRRQLDEPPPRPSDVRPDVPGPLDELVHALLAHDPDDRPDTAAEVYDVLAPLAQDPPPIPDVRHDDATEAVRAYAAIVGRVPRQTGHASAPGAARGELDLDQLAKQADQLYAAGQFRAAARKWRRLADQWSQQSGDDDPRVFDLRLRAARAHVRLGEHDRALRQLHTLLRDQVRRGGPDHATVLQLRQEIDQVSRDRPASDR